MASTKQVALWPFWMTENAINYFAISDQYAIFICFWFFFTPGGHFGWPKITFERISRHFRSMRNFFLKFCSENSYRRPFWMTKNHFRSHFSPFQINTQLSFFLNCFSKWLPAAILEVRFAPKTIGFFHYVLSMAMPNMQLIGEYMTQLETPQAFWAFSYKRSDAKNHKVLVIWDLNGYGEYEFDWCICDQIMALYNRWRWRAAAAAAEMAAQLRTKYPQNFQISGYNYYNAILPKIIRFL